MGIFNNRPFFLFCSCFMCASVIACALGGIMDKLAAFLLCALLALLFFILSGRKKFIRVKYKLISAFIAFVFASVAFLASALAIDLPLRSYEKHVAPSRAIEFLVLEEKHSTKYSTSYLGKLLSTDIGKVNASSYLYLDHEADYTVGEILYLEGSVSIYEGDGATHLKLPSSVRLSVEFEGDKDIIISKEYTETYNDIKLSLVFASIREYVKGVYVSLLDFDSAAMAVAFLGGDTSMLDAIVVRDFRRTGLLHLLAVSGLHITVLLGLSEAVLNRFCVSKRKRCAVMTLFCILLLIESGFSGSATRSVIMFFITLLCYELSRESDALTSLGISGFLILLFSPISVGDIGFWLSYLATFGIITYMKLFPFEVQTDAYKKIEGSRIKLVIVGLLRKTAYALTLTLCANLFICILFYIFFGEISVISPIANLFVGPLGDVCLVAVILFLPFGKIPIINSVLSYVISVLTTLITRLVSAFSLPEISVVSLSYPFAGIIIICATVAMLVLLALKLPKRKRRTLLLPPVLGILSFCICFFIYNALDTQLSFIYTSRNAADAVIFRKRGEAVMVDVGDGGYSCLSEAYALSRECGITELCGIVLTHYHQRHIPTLDRMLRTCMVRELYIPLPRDKDELDIIKDIGNIASECGVEIKMYFPEELLPVGEHMSILNLAHAGVDGSSVPVVSFLLEGEEGE